MSRGGTDTFPVSAWTVAAYDARMWTAILAGASFIAMFLFGHPEPFLVGFLAFLLLHIATWTLTALADRREAVHAGEEYRGDIAAEAPAGYVVWLVCGFLMILVTVVLTWIVIASIPDGCPSCGMAVAGVAPLWLLSLAIMAVNCIAIPRFLINRWGRKRGPLNVVSWIYGVGSAATVLFCCGSFVATQVFFHSF
jgi:hypothetical protein